VTGEWLESRRSVPREWRVERESVWIAGDEVPVGGWSVSREWPKSGESGRRVAEKWPVDGKGFGGILQRWPKSGGVCGKRWPEMSESISGEWAECAEISGRWRELARDGPEMAG